MKNQNGTGKRDCYCGSWINHWLNYTESYEIPKCIVDGCNNQADRGAHIEFLRRSGQELKSYIGPMCVDHNNQRGLEFQSKPNIKVARANVSETCGK